MSTLKEEALRYHEGGRPGKTEVIPTKPHKTAEDLSLAYSPGVAFPCLEIQNEPNTVYRYTNKGNLVAVISNGTAVLGLGDIGAMSGKPVMEGKGLLFKIYGGVDVFDIEVAEKDPEKFCETVERIAPTFGGINLEDIKAPECFYIEDRLKKSLDIPVMHDDQHGTAIISSAGLMNALEVVGKKIEDIKIVVNGAGAAAISCTRLYVRFGARKENIVMLDSKGVITSDRENLTESKKEFATDRRDVHTLEEAIVGADMFLGLSKGNVMTQDMVRSMADKPIVFALANPTPEISYEDAKASRPDVLIATGRSDYPNQINNVIGFPYIFRGALDVQATAINEEMKMAAARAIAAIAKKPVPKMVSEIYKVKKLTFGPDYFIPKPIDPRLITDVSTAVAKAAVESGVAKKKIADWDEYNLSLRRIMGYESRMLQGLYGEVKNHPQRLVFVDGEIPNVLMAAAKSLKNKICKPIILGDKTSIAAKADDLKIDISGIETIDPKCEDKHILGMRLVNEGKADGVLIGINGNKEKKIEDARQIIGLLPGFSHFATFNIVLTKDSFYYIGDTLINSSPDKETLKDVARLLNTTMKALDIDPVIAAVSYDSSLMREVAEELRAEGMIIDWQVTLDQAFDTEYGANGIIFGSLTESNIACKTIRSFASGAEILGPVQIGLKKAVHFIDLESSVTDIMNSAVIAGFDAYLKTVKE